MLVKELQNIKPGDKLLLRTWEDMAEEYYIDEDGDIDPGELLEYFYGEDEDIAGTIVTVKGTTDDKLIIAIEESDYEIFPWCVEKVVNVQLKHTGMMEKLLKRKETL